MSDDNEKVTLPELCKQHGVTIETGFTGLHEKDGWHHFGWNVVLGYDGRHMRLDKPYCCGVGHSEKVSDRKGMLNAKRAGRLLYGAEALGLRGATDDRWVPVPPQAADVLHSLLLDASAMDATFEEWANEYGYSADSMKAKETYELCRTYGLRVRRLLGDQLAKFEAAAQDY